MTNEELNVIAEEIRTGKQYHPTKARKLLRSIEISALREARELVETIKTNSEQRGFAIPPATAWALAMGLQKEYNGHVLSDGERKVLATIVLGGVLKSGPEHLSIGIRMAVRTRWPDIDWDGVEKDILETHSTS